MTKNLIFLFRSVSSFFENIWARKVSGFSWRENNMWIRQFSCFVLGSIWLPPMERASTDGGGAAFRERSDSRFLARISAYSRPTKPFILPCLSIRTILVVVKIHRITIVKYGRHPSTYHSKSSYRSNNHSNCLLDVALKLGAVPIPQSGWLTSTFILILYLPFRNVLREVYRFVFQKHFQLCFQLWSCA